MTYAVVDKRTGQVVSQTNIANPVTWPNGDVSHGTAVGMEYRHWTLVPVTHDAPPNEFYAAQGERTPHFDGAKVVLRGTYVPRDMVQVRAVLLQRVESTVAALHARYLAAGPGAALVYQHKCAEAAALAKDLKPDPANYPLLAATVGIEGATLAAVAERVRAKEREWLAAAAAIERTRKTARQSIEQAATVDEALKAFGAIRWEAP